MAKRNLNPCGCDMFIPFGFTTNFLGIPICATVMCICCKKKARARTIEKAIEKWNRRQNNEQTMQMC
jgi:hypothetical protein